MGARRVRAGGLTRGRAKADATFSEVFERTLQTLGKNSRLFPGGIAHLQMSVCLENGTKVDLEVHGFGPQTSPKVSETYPEAEHDPCHEREFVEATEASQDIPSLNLGTSAETAAKELLGIFPSDIRFTSGRRTVSKQVSAMARNVLRNRKYIQQTYKESLQRDALQMWVNNNQNLTSEPDIAKGLESIINTWSVEEQRNFSRHMTGDAFDVLPVGGGKRSRNQGGHWKTIQTPLVDV